MCLISFLDKWMEYYTRKEKHISFNEVLFREVIRILRNSYIKTYKLLKTTKHFLCPISDEDAIKHGIVILAQDNEYMTFLLENSLEKIGFTNVEVLPATQLYKLYFNHKFCIVFYANSIKDLPIANYVIVQLEQKNSSWFTDNYFARLKQASAVWDFSSANIKYLVENNVSSEKIFLTPLSNIVNYGNFLKRKNINLYFGEKEYDVVFYGFMNERRQKFLDRISSQYNLAIVYGSGEQLYNKLLKAKIVVNIHYYENASLESVRIYECLSLGVDIVSETASDIDEYIGLEKYVKFTPDGDIDAMLNAIKDILENYKEGSNINEEINDYSGSIENSFKQLGLLNNKESKE